MNELDGSAMKEDEDPPNAPGDIRSRAAAILDAHWLAEGYTMPNRATYPWQWLWDSCFHSIAWAELGDDRALVELEQLFVFQTARGFVPHMNYHPDPAASVELWGRRGASTITQPPMYGHAIAELVARGMVPGDQTIEAAKLGLDFLLRHRRRTAHGLIELVHPWESGCDDSARWDAALDEPWNRDAWRAHKHRLIGSVQTDDQGGAIANDDFVIGSVGFNALVAFNALELDRAVGASELRSAAVELTEAIAARWDAGLRTWVDDGALAESSGRVRTADAHFALLVDATPDHLDAAAGDLVDHQAFGAEYGPAGTHRDEPTYDPTTYWRGPAWPQMSYLLWVALVRSGHTVEAASVAASLTSAMTRSGFAEYWHPDTGEGLGAIPQSWATMGLLTAGGERSNATVT